MQVAARRLIAQGRIGSGRGEWQVPLELEAARYPKDLQAEQGRGGGGGRSEARQVAAAQALVLAQAREDRESGQEGGAAHAAMEGQVYEREGRRWRERRERERMCVI